MQKQKYNIITDIDRGRLECYAKQGKQMAEIRELLHISERNFFLEVNAGVSEEDRELSTSQKLLKYSAERSAWQRKENEKRKLLVLKKKAMEKRNEEKNFLAKELVRMKHSIEDAIEENSTFHLEGIPEKMEKCKQKINAYYVKYLFGDLFYYESMLDQEELPKEILEEYQEYKNSNLDLDVK